VLTEILDELMHYGNVIAVDRPDDPRVDAFRNVKDAASRSRGLFLAESELVISRMFDSGWFIKALLVSNNRYQRLRIQIEAAQSSQIERHGVDSGFSVFVCEQAIVEAVVGFPLHRGCLAICDRPHLPTIETLLSNRQTIVVLDDVVDPDNIGSVFRHVAGFGADAVVLSAHAGDPLYRKSVRASMGWVLEVPYSRLATREALLPSLHDAGFKTVALTPRRDAPTLRSVIGKLRPVDRVALLLGAEAPGLADHTIANATFQARIPMTEHVDSLNVATAGALALYELATAHPSRVSVRPAPPELVQHD
jgi:tRNA G18 (ribose-2'-O)-methylase SpoU